MEERKTFTAVVLGNFFVCLLVDFKQATERLSSTSVWFFFSRGTTQRCLFHPFHNELSSSVLVKLDAFSACKLSLRPLITRMYAVLKTKDLRN